jgi:hypothetical protein
VAEDLSLAATNGQTEVVVGGEMKQTRGNVTQNRETTVVGKNRQRAFWALVIVGFMCLVSIVLLATGLVGRSGILWTPVWLGAVGLLGFGASAALVIRTLRSPWHLAVHPTHLRLHTPTYLLDVPWENVAGIAVDEVNFRLGCVLIFEDPAAVAGSAQFLARSTRHDVVTDAGTMLARMRESYDNLGYHLGIPGRILEKGPEELADLLVKARTGQLWQKGEAAA